VFTCQGEEQVRKQGHYHWTWQGEEQADCGPTLSAAHRRGLWRGLSEMMRKG